MAVGTAKHDYPFLPLCYIHIFTNHHIQFPLEKKISYSTLLPYERAVENCHMTRPLRHLQWLNYSAMLALGWVIFCPVTVLCLWKNNGMEANILTILLRTHIRLEEKIFTIYVYSKRHNITTVHESVVWYTVNKTNKASHQKRIFYL